MRALGHPLCVGLDPYLDRLPTPFRRGAMAPQRPDTAHAVEEFCSRIIDLIAGDVAIVKLQVALFDSDLPRGPFVYSQTFWTQDCVGLRDPTLAQVEATLALE